MKVCNAFLIITKALAAEKRISAAAKLLLAQLLDHRNRQTGQCNPKIATLAQELGLSISTAGRAMRSLREAGMVKVKWRQRSSQYEILFGQIDRSCSVKLTDQKSQSFNEPSQSKGDLPKKSVQREAALERYYAKQRKAGRG